MNNSQNKMLTSRNFSRRREKDEDLRQSSISSNNSLYKNPVFESVTKKFEEGKLLPYNYSEKKVIVRKKSISEKEKLRAENLLTTSQFSKLYRKELDSSSSVVIETSFVNLKRKKYKNKIENKQYRMNFCRDYNSNSKYRQQSSSQLEEYLGTKEPEQMVFQQKTLGFNTEYDFQGKKAKQSEVNLKYYNRPSKKKRNLTNSQIRRIKPKMGSKKSSVKKSNAYSSRKKNSISINDQPKTSKWVKKTSTKSQYEKWKQSKKEKIIKKHIRKQSEQLFSTMKENSSINTLFQGKNRQKERIKTRKKLSIDINKNVLGHSNVQYHG
jgi:hypothetical protein